MITIDLNADMGESFGAYTIGADEAVMTSISSANVACGYHGGDPAVMRRTVRLAREAGVAVGAHPGFPDLAGFGRREMRIAPKEVEDIVLYQVGALAAIARGEGVRLAREGAWCAVQHGGKDRAGRRNRSCRRGVRSVADSLRRFQIRICSRRPARAGLRVALEGFADRAYEPDGSLTPRSRAGAVIHDVDVVVERAVRMAAEGIVIAADGSELSIHVDTICTHGDTPGAQALTRALRAGLEKAGYARCAVAGTPR